MSETESGAQHSEIRLANPTSRRPESDTTSIAFARWALTKADLQSIVQNIFT